MPCQELMADKRMSSGLSISPSKFLLETKHLKRHLTVADICYIPHLLHRLLTTWGKKSSLPIKK